MSASVRAIGWKAHAALVRNPGARAGDLPRFGDSAYRLADGEPIWIGTGDVAMHPRAVVFETHSAAIGPLRLATIEPWRAPRLQLDTSSSRRLREGCAALALGALGCDDPPPGFATLLAGRPPAFPLDRAVPYVRLLARAIDRDEAHLAYAAALPLLGLGPGLTPSGDDFVGAALFARRLFGMDGAWTAATLRLIDMASTRTHAIGAALFRDLAEGHSFAPLHRLAECLAAGEPAQAAARDLTAIGHSSGFDMLAGFITGAIGTAALPDFRVDK